jgi:hypothetical protein
MMMRAHDAMKSLAPRLNPSVRRGSNALLVK